MTYGVSPEVFEAAVSTAQNTPDPCLERVDVAVDHLRSGALDAQVVAEAVISSILSEAQA